MHFDERLLGLFPISSKSLICIFLFHQFFNRFPNQVTPLSSLHGEIAAAYAHSCYVEHMSSNKFISKTQFRLSFWQYTKAVKWYLLDLPYGCQHPLCMVFTVLIIASLMYEQNKKLSERPGFSWDGIVLGFSLDLGGLPPSSRRYPLLTKMNYVLCLYSAHVDSVATPNMLFCYS